MCKKYGRLYANTVPFYIGNLSIRGYQSVLVGVLEPIPCNIKGQVYGETVETVSDFIFWGSKITADGDCSHEIKTRLLLGRKVMTNLDSILKAETLLYQQSSV